MKNCHNCTACKPDKLFDTQGNFALVGNMNVGKSRIFARLKGQRAEKISLPGSSSSIRCAPLPGGGRLFDTPGICSIFANNEDELAARDIFLFPPNPDTPLNIVLVADAKHLKRSIAIALQFCQYHLPMVLVLNMVDEAHARGIEIDHNRLAEILGIEVVTTVAASGMGLDKLKNALNNCRIPQKEVVYPPDIERYLTEVEGLIGPHNISPRLIALLLLTDDPAVDLYLKDNFPPEIVEPLKALAESQKSSALALPELSLGNVFFREAERITEEVMSCNPPSKNSLVLKFGDWCTKVSTGIPIAIVVLSLMYLFVGDFGATFLVDTINNTIFQQYLIPWSEQLLGHIPYPFIRDMIIDPDFGILPTGVFLATGLVAPVIFCFYLAFGFLENSGYLVRVSLLLDRVFKLMGLNGRGVIPLVMGFSCVTMALLTTRILGSEKEKNIASFLLFLCMPCAPLIAVMLIILRQMPLSATIFVFTFIFIQLILAGYMANLILPGGRTPLMLEIPAMRVPKFMPLFKMALAKTYYFMKEALPIFIYASMAVFVFQRLGGLDTFEKFMGPFMGKVLGLPEQSIQVFIKTIIRRESGAAELQHLHQVYTNLQLVVNMLVMTFIAPCLNAIMVLFKERGARAATIILGAVTVYATFIGSVVNYGCKWLAISFS